MSSRQGSRMTRQRRSILEELRKVKSHPSAGEVYKKVRRRLPRISLGTVYRNLEVLSEEGLIRKLEVGGIQRRYDANFEDHYHVRCLSCDRVEDVPLKPERKLEENVRGRTEYEIFGHRLEFIGLCPACRRTRAKALASERKEEKTNGIKGSQDRKEHIDGVCR